MATQFVMMFAPQKLFVNFRLACGLGGKTVFPHILNTTPQMMQHPDWKCRHAALMAISAAGEGCHKQMESYLPQIMEAVMNFVNDSVSDKKYRF